MQGGQSLSRIMHYPAFWKITVLAYYELFVTNIGEICTPKWKTIIGLVVATNSMSSMRYAHPSFVRLTFKDKPFSWVCSPIFYACVPTYLNAYFESHAIFS